MRFQFPLSFLLLWIALFAAAVGLVKVGSMLNNDALTVSGVVMGGSCLGAPVGSFVANEEHQAEFAVLGMFAGVCLTVILSLMAY